MVSSGATTTIVRRVLSGVNESLSGVVGLSKGSLDSNRYVSVVIRCLGDGKLCIGHRS